MKTKSFKILFVVLFINTWINAYTQTSIFQPAGISYEDLTEQAQEMYDLQVTIRGQYSEVHLVTINDLSSVQEDGNIFLSIPNDPKSAWISSHRTETYNNGYFYSGEVFFNPELMSLENFYEDGFFSILKSDDIFTGTFILGEETYGVTYLDDGIYVVIKEDHGDALMSCGNNDSDAVLPYDYWDIPYGSSSSRNDAYCPVKILALYTENALNQEGGEAQINRKIRLSIENANQTLLNSTIAPNEIHFDLVDVLPFNFVEAGGDIFKELNQRLIPLMSSPMSDLAMLRNAHQADIVVLYTKANYGNGILGIAGALDLEPERAIVMISIIDANTAMSTLTSHELGHTFRAKHNTGNPNQPGFEYPHHLKTGGIFGTFRRNRSTTMRTMQNWKTFIPYYSNPRIQFKGEDLGIEDRRDVARMINAVGCDVAAFRTEDVLPLLVNTIGPRVACNCTFVPIYVNVSGGFPGAYSFFWETSNDGFNYTPSNFSDDFIVIDMTNCGGLNPPPIGSPPIAYVRVTVTAANGETQTRMHQVRFSNSVDQDGNPCLGNDPPRIGDKKNVKTYLISPNPVGDDLSIQIMGETLESTSLNIYNEYGQNVYKMMDLKNYMSGNQIKVSTKDLSSGIYFIVIRGPLGERETLKFIKPH